jgi:hypothetical protein
MKASTKYIIWVLNTGNCSQGTKEINNVIEANHLFSITKTGDQQSDLVAARAASICAGKELHRSSNSSD